MERKNILFSDANHGGLVLLEEYYKYTQNNLFFYDIYSKLSESEKKEFAERFNVTFLSLAEIRKREDSFVKINPVHMPPVIRTDFTHHEFVSYLLEKMNVDFKLIQVTGVKGKTTVTSLLREVFRDYNTLVLTSDKVTYKDETLIEKLSITPASIITALNLAKYCGVFDDIDYAIFEVSLGVVPNGHINVLTNILEDYPIAKGSSCASRAKESVFTSKDTLCDYESYVNYYSNYTNVVSLSFDDCDADIYAYDIDYNFDNSRFMMKYFDDVLEINHFALSDFYINNLLFAISVGLMENIDVDRIISNLKRSEIVEGRNSYTMINGKIIIEDVNPGLNTTSIKKCIDNLAKFGIDHIIILGGDYGITCEEIDEERLSDYLNNISKTDIVLTGKIGENLAKNSNNSFKYIPELEEAMDFCINMDDKNIIQVIYRSEYNSNKNKITKLK